MVAIKRRFDPEHETLDEMIDGVYALLQPARRGVESTSDKETRLLLRLPNVVTGALVRGADVLDRFGLLPLAMIEPDPMFTTMFVANLGSVGHEAGFHHLWERGTCSAFCVIGRVKSGPAGRRMVDRVLDLGRARRGRPLLVRLHQRREAAAREPGAAARVAFGAA